MTIIADLHIHGKYSRATSKDLTLPKLEKYAKIKGVSLLGTGDFTHPQWIEHLKESLIRKENEIYYTKTNFPFMLTTEISLVYTQDNKGRRVHNLVLAPSFEVVSQITEWLKTKGRVDYDGRPIFKIPCPEFVESLRSISKDIEVIPAHIWTPWFGLLGSNSGFNSVQEAFHDQTKYIHALETGLSSDPIMNWRLSQLDKYSLVSFSDLHSFWPHKIGREATIFDCKLSYDSIIKSLHTKERLAGTVEVNPADAKTYHTLIPLSEIISAIMGRGIMTKSVVQEYNKISKIGHEFKILLHTPREELIKYTDIKIADAIIRYRNGEVKIEPGYDGVYGKPLF